MAVIKHAESGRLAKPAIVLDLGDLRRVAEEMERRALERAAGILDDARRERVRILDGAEKVGQEQGFGAGHAKGLETGGEAGRREALASMTDQLQKLREAWNTALSTFEQHREELLLAAQTEVLALAVAVAERVTKRLVKLDGQIVKDQLAAALALAVRPSRLSVEVSADDLALSQEVLPELMQRFGPDMHATLSAGASLSRGSVIVRTEVGEIDASIDAQLDRIIEAILPAHTPPAREGAS